MRKNKLIELLNKIPGNPEVVLWNGIVEDYQPIAKEVVEHILVKQSKEHIRLAHSFDNLSNSFREVDEAVVDKCFKQQGWEFPNRYLKKEEYDKWYGKHQKKVIVIGADCRNKAYWDRSGSISY